MGEEKWAKATLVVLGHGSTMHPESGTSVMQHAEALRARRIFQRVEPAFWKQEPRLMNVLKAVTTPIVYVVPLMISQGYFSDLVIPRALGLTGEPGSIRAHREGDRVLVYGEPVGTHPKMAEVIVARALQVVAEHPFPRAPKPSEMALLVAGHGTERNQNSRQAIELQVQRIQRLGMYAEVHAVFLEETPRIADWHQVTTLSQVVMVPFFISDGLHARQDIPVLLGESAEAVEARTHAGQWSWRNPTEKHGRRLWYSPSAGTDAGVGEVVLARVREADHALRPEAQVC